MVTRRDDPVEPYLAQAVGAFDLRPMTSSEMLSETTRIYRLNAMPLLKSTLSGSALIYGSLVLAWSLVFPSFSQTSSPDSLATQGIEALISVVVLFFLLAPVCFIGFSLLSANSAGVVVEAFMGEEVEVSDMRVHQMVQLIYRILLPTVVVVIAGGALLFLGAVLSGSEFESISALTGILAISGFAAAVFVMLRAVTRNSLAPFAMYVENLAPAEAMKRSHKLTKYAARSGMTLEFLTNLLVAWVVLFGAIAGVYLVALSLLDAQFSIADNLTPFFMGQTLWSILQSLGLFLALWVLSPYWGVGSAVAYLESRVRHEGLDIEIANKKVSR